jgi:hypothetical protein
MPTLTVPEAFEATNRRWMAAHQRGAWRGHRKVSSSSKVVHA